MKKIVNILFLFSLLPINSQWQNAGSIGNPGTIKSVIKVTKTIDSTFDGKVEKTSEKATINIPEIFLFTSSLEVKMTINDEDSVQLEYLLGSYSDIYAMRMMSDEMDETSKVYNVITPKSTTTFININGMKMKQSVSQDQFSQINYGDKVPSNPDDLKKTGASKSILGYTCFEYKYTNEGGYVSVWASKKFPLQGTNNAMLGMKENSVIEGFVIEINIKSGNDKAKIEAVKWNKDKKVTINTNEYKAM